MSALIWIVLIAASLVFTPLAAVALDGKSLVTRRCASCHDIAGPPPTTFAGVLARKAPDLFYAGSKFNRSWLVDWLQGPTVIRRSGVMFLNHITTVNGKDRIEEGAVAPCPAKLTREQAVAAAGYLMSLTDTDMATNLIDPSKTFKRAKAFRLFIKRLPCVGCHMIGFGKRIVGGISGPDLTGAGERLNPDWVYARIENPQHWDPKTWMPRIEMSHRKRELLTLFITSQR